jgi:hypothetical protein
VHHIADHHRVLVQLLLHEMAEIALADGSAGEVGELDRAFHGRAVVGKEAGVLTGHHHPVAVFKIGDLPGKGGERQRVGAEIHGRLAIAYGQRRAALRTDYQLGVAGEDQRQGIGAFQPRKGGLRRVDRGQALSQQQVQQLCHRLGVGFGGKNLPGRLQFGTQFRMVLYDAVMHHGDPRGAMRMRV